MIEETYRNNGCELIVNDTVNGNVSISGGTLTGGIHTIINTNGSNLTITGGTIYSSRRETIYHNSVGTVQIDNCEVITESAIDTVMIANITTGTITINGGEFTYTGRSIIWNDRAGVVNLNGGTFSANASDGTIRNSSTGTINIGGGTYSSTNNVVVGNSAAGTINIDDGTFSTNSGNTIYNWNNGKININGGTFTSGSGHVINNASTGEITITGGELTTNTGNGINNTSTGPINVLGGTIISNSKNGINNTSTATIVLGINNDRTYPTAYPNINADEDFPVIKGGDYGINTPNGRVNFYDGIVYVNTTSEDTINGTIADTPYIYEEGQKTAYKYSVLYKDETREGTEEVEHYAILGKEIEAKIKNSTGDDIGEYYSITDAFDAYQTDESLQDKKTITLEGKILVSEDVPTITIEENSDIVLDLNGKTVTASNPNFIKNMGTFEIIDSSEGKTGKINGASNLMIDNYGTLKINDAQISSIISTAQENNSSVIKNASGANLIIDKSKIEITDSGSNNNKTAGIYNAGTLEIKDINLSGTAKTGIYNDGGIITKIESGNISIKYGGASKAIYNSSEGIINSIGNGEDELNILGDYINTGFDGKGLAIYNDGLIRQINNNVNLTSDGYVFGSSEGIYNTGTIENISEGCTINPRFSRWSGTGNTAYGIHNTGLIRNLRAKITKDGSYTWGILNSGTIESVNSELIEGASRAIVNESAGTITVVGGTINSTSGAAIENTGTIAVHAGTITSGSGYAINNKGTADVKGGTLSSNSNYGVNNAANATFTLGIDDENTYPTEYPTINSEVYPIVTGANYGLYNLGTFNFYDGMIFVNNNSANAIYGTISDTAKIYEDDEPTTNRYIVVYKDETRPGSEDVEHYAMLQKQVISKIRNSLGEIIGEYYTLEDAVNDYQTNTSLVDKKTITLENRLSISAAFNTMVINQNTNMIIDLQGNELTTSDETLIENHGNLEIIDSSEGKTGKIESKAEVLIDNCGTLKTGEILINSTTTASGTSDTTISMAVIKNENNANLTVDNTNINVSDTGNYKIASAINNDSEGEVEINNCNISITISGDNKAKSSAIYNKGELGIETINIGGSAPVGIYNDGGLITKIKSGNISMNYGGESKAIHNSTGGTISEIGNGENELYLAGIADTIVYGNGQAIYNEGTITEIGNNVRLFADSIGDISYSKGIYNTGNIDVIKEGCTINVEGTSYYGSRPVGSGIENIGIIGEIKANIRAELFRPGYGILNSGTIENLNGKIYSPDYAIKNTGEITVTGGRTGINELDETQISEYGIYNLGTLNLVGGEIYGSIVGNHSSEIFNFNGGEIYGLQDVILGHITSIPEQKEVLKDQVDSYTKFYIGNIPSALVAIGGNQYNTIEEAVSAASSGDTLKLLRSAILVSSIDIPSDKNIIFDLNGNSIESYSDGYSFNNIGTLEITNSSTETESTIKASSHGILNNEGTAVINNVIIKNQISGTESEWKNLIINNGQLDITDLDANIDKEYTRLIDNEQGAVNFNSGNVTLSANNTRVIYNKDDLEINGGTFTSEDRSNVRLLENVNDSYAIIQTATVDFKDRIIDNTVNSTLTIKDGSYITSKNGIVNNDSTEALNIEGGNFTTTGTEEMIINRNVGSVNITGGTFDATGVVLINKSTGNVAIDNCTIVSKENNAVYNESTGEITIGNNDGQVSTETPKIVSYTNYGVYNNTTGTIRYCDGQIIGKTGTVYGTLLIPSTHKINQEDNVTEGEVEGLTKITLVPKGDTVAVASVNGINYETLQAALDVCREGQEITVKIEAEITQQDVVQILQGRTITMDLNGHTISTNVEIQNSGVLKIKNSQGTVEPGTYGTITGSGTVDIIN